MYVVYQFCCNAYCMWFVRGFSIDANDEVAEYGPGRLINHSVLDANIRPVFCKDLQRLFFVADEDIPAGAQLFYDYNDRDPEALQEPDNSFLKRPPKRPVSEKLQPKKLKNEAKQKKSRGRPSKRKLASSSRRRSSSPEADTVSIHIYSKIYSFIGLCVIRIVLNMIA